jgi:transposase, IS30 family
MKQAGKKQNIIAKSLGVSASTISREISRNTGKRGYRPKQAHDKALERRHNSRKALMMTFETIKYIENKLLEQHSPEQICKRMKIDRSFNGEPLSHERIYQHIWFDKASGGTLYKHLRIAGTKKRRKRRNSRDMRGTIKNRVGIEFRPDIVDRMARTGDWEGDTVVGKNHKGALVTLVDRKSKLALIGKVERYTTKAVGNEVVRLLNLPYKRNYTLTLDNGKEFASHESIAEKMKISVYFADPYSPWQRGLNENTNGLIKQYVPKSFDIRALKQEDIEKIMHRLNNRPRKSLGFLTPNEVYYSRKILTRQCERERVG